MSGLIELAPILIEYLGSMYGLETTLGKCSRTSRDVASSQLSLKVRSPVVKFTCQILSYQVYQVGSNDRAYSFYDPQILLFWARH